MTALKGHSRTQAQASGHVTMTHALATQIRQLTGETQAPHFLREREPFARTPKDAIGWASVAEMFLKSGRRRPLPSEQMPPFLDELRRWFEVYSDAGGRRGIRVQFTDGPPELPMRSALITAQGAAAIGQLTLWESGKCDTEAHATGDPTPILLRSRVLDEPARVPAIADDLIDHVADYSNS